MISRLSKGDDATLATAMETAEKRAVKRIASKSAENEMNTGLELGAVEQKSPPPPSFIVEEQEGVKGGCRRDQDRLGPVGSQQIIRSQW